MESFVAYQNAIKTFRRPKWTGKLCFCLFAWNDDGVLFNGHGNADYILWAFGWTVLCITFFSSIECWREWRDERKSRFGQKKMPLILIGIFVGGEFARLFNDKLLSASRSFMSLVEEHLMVIVTPASLCLLQWLWCSRKSIPEEQEENGQSTMIWTISIYWWPPTLFEGTTNTIRFFFYVQ